MRTKIIIGTLLILFSTLWVNAQIKVTGDGDQTPYKVGFYCTPNIYSYYMFKINGSLRMTPSSGNSYLDITNGPILVPNANCVGTIGGNHRFRYINLHSAYATNIQLSSDRNLKKNIFPLSSAMPIIEKLRPVMFDYNYDFSDIEDASQKNKLQTNNQNKLGFIAQEVKEILPETVFLTEPDSTLAIRMMDFIPVLVKGMQEQSTRIDSLKNVLRKIQNSMKNTQVNNMNNNEPNIKLDKNNVKTFLGQTVINFYIPESCKDAQLMLFNMQGALINSFSINERNKTSVMISDSELDSGMYIYSLISDNKEIDTKSFIIENYQN